MDRAKVSAISRSIPIVAQDEHAAWRNGEFETLSIGRFAGKVSVRHLIPLSGVYLMVGLAGDLVLELT